MRLINNHRQPITLDGGTVLAAAGTPGSIREVESITDRDRRRNAGRITIIETPQTQAAQGVAESNAPVEPARVVEADAAKADKDVSPRRRSQ